MTSHAGRTKCNWFKETLFCKLEIWVVDTVLSRTRHADRLIWGSKTGAPIKGTQTGLTL